MLLKHAPTPAEIEEGVAFYGRSGNALMKSFKRLGIDPLAIYGTLCVKCPVADPSLAADECIARLVEEMAIVSPRVIVVMGEPALEILDGLELPMSRPLEPRLGEVQSFTPTIDAIFVPDIDASLDSESSKRAFWRNFRALGDWYAELPVLERGYTGPWTSRSARSSRCRPVSELRRDADRAEKQTALERGARPCCARPAPRAGARGRARRRRADGVLDDAVSAG